jgi:hypothetical protein
MSLTFGKTLVRAGHVKSFHIGRVPAPAAGWEVCEESDHQVLQRRSHLDWHRVERARERFSQLVDQLRREGWREA